MNNNIQLLEIAKLFDVDGCPAAVRPLGNGNINDTYLVECLTADESPDRRFRYVLQRINTNVFVNPKLLQNNLKLITNHIRNVLKRRGCSDIGRKVLECIPTLDGELYTVINGDCWRMTRFIENSRTLSSMTPKLAAITGKAFAEFHSMMAEDDAPVPSETIPNFHNMVFRLRQLREAISADIAGRLNNVRTIPNELFALESDMTLAERLAADGHLPKRICHCDTKIDNILFDNEGGILCVIDLDTTMPGYIMSDFGDFVRTACNTGCEDDPQLEHVGLNFNLFAAFATGYVGNAEFLTDTERQTLAYGAARMTYMQTVRFLTDYLNGDTYFKTAYPEHNLVRTRAQLTLLHSLLDNMQKMNSLIDGLPYPAR